MVERTGEAVILKTAESVDGGFKCVFSPEEADFGAFDIDAGLLDFGAEVHGFIDEILNGLDGFVFGDADFIGGDDAGIGEGGARDAGSGEGVFDHRFLLEQVCFRDGQFLLAARDFGFGADDFDRGEGADFDLFLIVVVEFLVQGESLALDDNVFVGGDKVPVEADDAGDGGDDLLFKDEFRNLVIIPGDANISVINGEAKALEQTLLDLDIAIQGLRGVEIQTAGVLVGEEVIEAHADAGTGEEGFADAELRVGPLRN